MLFILCACLLFVLCAIEGPTQAHVPHVAREVRTLGIQFPTDLEHLRRLVDQGHPVASLQMRGIAPTARAQLEHFSHTGGTCQETMVDRRFAFMVFRWEEVRPPGSEIRIELEGIRHAGALYRSRSLWGTSPRVLEMQRRFGSEDPISCFSSREAAS